MPGCLDGYIAGFPCQPFSRQSTAPKSFSDSRTEVLRSVLQTVAWAHPRWCVLENVPGILSEKNMHGLNVLFDEEKITDMYYVHWVRICPQTVLNEPIRRPRVYFILVRKDSAVTSCESAQRELVSSLLEAVRNALPDASLDDYLGQVAKRKDSAHVQKEPSDKQGSSRKKWMAYHEAVRKEMGLEEKTDRALAVYCDQMTDRQTSLVGLIFQTKMGDLEDMQYPVVVDVSQSLNRIPMGFGYCPCLTTSATPCIISKEGRHRLLSSHECLALMGFPLSMVTIPDTVSDRSLHFMAGNSMHVSAVGLGILLAMCLVDWQGKSREPLVPVALPTQRMRRKASLPEPGFQMREVVSLAEKKKKKQPRKKTQKVKAKIVRRASDLYSRVPLGCAVRKVKKRPVSSSARPRAVVSSCAGSAKAAARAVSVQSRGVRRRLSDLYRD